MYLIQMQQRTKRLCRLGNSLALIVERPILRAMQIGAGTEFYVHTDGVRIIAERPRVQAHDPRASARRAFEMRKRDFLETAETLVNSIGPNEMVKLGGERYALFRFRSNIKHATECSPRDHLVMDRLEHVRSALERGSNLYDAIDRAIAAVPGSS